MRQAERFRGHDRTEVDLVVDHNIRAPTAEQIRKRSRASATKSADEVGAHGSPLLINVVDDEWSLDRSQPARSERTEALGP